MNKIENFLVGAAIGLAVGATLAILLAPSSGEELRDNIKLEIQRIQDEMQQAGEAKRIELEQQLALLRAPRKSGGTVS